MAWKDKIRNPNCTLCPLHKSADHVCLMGSGSSKARVMVVGEAPGEREDESHQAFVGPSGQLLRQTLSSTGIKPEECYITNVSKCRPPGNRQPTPSEIKTCVGAYLGQELQRVRPSHILLLGNSALRGVAGKSGITTHRGSTFEIGEATAFATFHPAFVLRSPYYRSTFMADVERFSRMVKGEDIDFEDTKIKLVKTKAHLRWLYRKLMEADVISYDIETWVEGTKGGEEWKQPGGIASISFSWTEGASAVVPLDHSETTWKDPYAVLRYLKPALERPECKYVAHNGKFDAKWLASRGVFVTQTFDTMLAAHMLDENRLKGLKPLSQTLLGASAYNVGVETTNSFHTPLRNLLLYNARDTDYTLRLYNYFKGQLKQEDERRTARVFTKLMMPASNALTKIESIGPYIDEERYDKRLKVTIARRDNVESKLRESCGGINLRSPQQVAVWLFGKKGKTYKVGPQRSQLEVVGLGLPIVETTNKGAPCTNESVILQLAKQTPEVKRLLEYRTLETKWIRTYFANWAPDKRDHRGRIHPGYKLFGTVTGRLSGDFQQVPRDPFIRSIVGAPPGWLFLEADYSQAELRIASWLANERRLLRAFAEGRDAHLETAVLLTGKRPGDVTSEERKKAKSVNFGFLFGMWWKHFIDYAFVNYGLDVSDGEAEQFYKRWHESYPAFRAWHERQRRLVRRYERVHSPIGRVRHLPTVRSSDRSMVSDAERQAINSPVQSFASDLMLLSLVRLESDLSPRAARIVGTVHDSLLFEVREDALMETAKQIHQTMTDLREVKRKFGTEIGVPIEVEMKVGTHWGKGKVLDLM
jgi:uracil-DNA glycosylase family 4